MTLNKIHETMTTSDGVPLLFQVDHRGDIWVDGFRIRRADVEQFIVVLNRVNARVKNERERQAAGAK